MGLLLAVAITVGGVARQPSESAADKRAQAAASSFLSAWVDPNGRVVRRDQGNDSVSEGQAYGMLLAVVADDRTEFDRIWTWTRTNLQQPDGLLAWRWVNGKVADEQSAADADIDAATALLLAGRKFGSAGSYTASGKSLASAALARETVPVSSGKLLAAGPWAVQSVATLNPSYLVAGSALMLARLTGDTGWDAVATATSQLDKDLLQQATLAPDWSQMNEGRPVSTVHATGAPDGSTGPQYGLDAPRLLIRLASSCDPSDRALAASAANRLGGLGQPAIRSLSGSPQVSWQHPVTDIAVAAGRAAQGDQAGAVTAIAAATKLNDQSATYYGAAWIALGTGMLTTNLLRVCGTS